MDVTMYPLRPVDDSPADLRRDGVIRTRAVQFRTFTEAETAARHRAGMANGRPGEGAQVGRELRNGLPEPVPYEYRRSEAGRDAQIADWVTEAKRQAQARADAEDEQLRQQCAGQDSAA